MEFASEMLIEASRLGLKIGEVPVKLCRAREGRVPHLCPLRDGLRHLWLMIRRFGGAGRGPGRRSLTAGPDR